MNFSYSCAWTTFHLHKPDDRETYWSPDCKSRRWLLWLCVNSLYCAAAVRVCGESMGRSSPTLNYSLVLTASLSTHQLTNPPSLQPSPSLLPPLQNRDIPYLKLLPTHFPNTLSVCVGHMLNNVLIIQEISQNEKHAMTFRPSRLNWQKCSSLPPTPTRLQCID